MWCLMSSLGLRPVMGDVSLGWTIAQQHDIKPLRQIAPLCNLSGSQYFAVGCICCQQTPPIGNMRCSGRNYCNRVLHYQPHMAQAKCQK